MRNVQETVPGLTDKRRTLIFINIIITGISTTMMSTALLAALPNIMSDLQISAGKVQWLSSSYYLCMAIMTPVTAYLITRFSTKKLYLSALIAFCAGLAVCLFSHSFLFLLFGRILQACSNGIITAMSQVVLMSIYPIECRGSIMGWFGLSQSAAPVVSPTIAGVLIDAFGWRAVFAFPLIIMLLSLVWAAFVFGDVLETDKDTLDISSFTMSILTFGGIALAVGNISDNGFFSAAVLVPLIVGGVTAVFFARRQLHCEKPFLKLSLLGNKFFLISVLSCMISFYISMSSTTLLPMYNQSILGLTATASGLLTLPGSLVSALIAPVSGKLYDKHGIKRLFLIGTMLLVISNVAMCFISIDMSPWIASALNVVRCLASGILYMPLLSWGCSSIAEADIAHGTALQYTMRNLAGTIGMNISVGIMTYVAKNGNQASAAAASMRGINAAFLSLGIICIPLFLMALRSGDSSKR